MISISIVMFINMATSSSKCQQFNYEDAEIKKLSLASTITNSKTTVLSNRKKNQLQTGKQ